jgi:hypothetical protein
MSAESKRQATIVQHTIAKEDNQTMHANIRTQVSPSIHSGLQFINVPVSTTDPSLSPSALLSQLSPDDIVWEKVIDRTAIEAQILKYNSAAFRAAAESPCGHGIIHDELTFTMLSPSAQHLLSGHVPPEWHKEDVQLEAFFASFAVPDHVRAHDDISSVISSSDIVRGIKKWRESAATSPSGRHLGYYKALITDPVLLDGLTKFLHVAISNGISVKRWSKAVNVLIEKDPGIPNINWLRIIHLFEADYNLFLKIQWGHRLVRRSVEFNLLHPGQHGSVPSRSTKDPIMLTQLTTNLCRT